MKMKKLTFSRLLKTGILFLGISILLWNCETESNDLELTQQSSQYEKLSVKEALLELEQISSNQLFQNKSTSQILNQIDKKTLVDKVVDNHGKKMYTFLLNKNSGSEKTFQKTNQNQIYYDNLFVNVDSDNNLQTQLLRFIPSNQWLNSSRNVSDYSGKIQFLSNDYQLTQSLNIEHGEQIETNSSSNKSFTKSIVCTYYLSGFVCIGSNDIGFRCTFYFSRSGCGGGSSRRNHDYGGGNNYNDDDSSGGGGNNGYTGYGNTGVSGQPILGTCLETNTCEEEVQIINELTGKEKCLHDLLDKNGNSYIKDLMSKFKGESEFDIKIVSKDKVTVIDDNGDIKEVNGTTSPIINDVITINISTSKANSRSGLDVARTILHEYIHADIRRKMKTISPSDSDKEFRDVFEQYGNEHHEVMGDLYVNSMRDAMKHFHKNVLTDDYNKYTTYYEEKPSDAFYEALAWRGLKEHDVKAWTDLSSTKKQELESLSLRVDVLTRAVTCPE